MPKITRQMCPLFPDQPCPQGEEARKQCEIRINGDFDPVLYFRDELVLHCALRQAYEHEHPGSAGKEIEKNDS